MANEIYALLLITIPSLLHCRKSLIPQGFRHLRAIGKKIQFHQI